MRIIRSIAIAVLILGVFVIIISAFSPTSIKVEESILINSSSDCVFEQLNDFKNWPSWSAWSERDKEIVWTFSDTSYGLGASMSWQSERVGSGHQQIQVSETNRHVITKLSFSGWKGDSYDSFFLEQIQGGTMVTRTLEGSELSFFQRGFGLLVRKMVREDYHNGLENLKKICEKKSKGLSMKIELQTIKPIKGLVKRDTAGFNDIGVKMNEAFKLVQDFLNTKKDQAVGPPFAVYFGTDKGMMTFASGMPVGKSYENTGALEILKINSGKAAVGYYYGPYEQIGKAHEQMKDWIKSNNLKEVGAPWEVYQTDPNVEKDKSKWLTLIYYPVN